MQAIKTCNNYTTQANPQRTKQSKQPTSGLGAHSQGCQSLGGSKINALPAQIPLLLTLLALNLLLHALDGVGALHIQGDGFSSESHDEDLHAGPQAMRWACRESAARKAPVEQLLAADKLRGMGQRHRVLGLLDGEVVLVVRMRRIHPGVRVGKPALQRPVLWVLVHTFLQFPAGHGGGHDHLTGRRRLPLQCAGGVGPQAGPPEQIMQSRAANVRPLV